MNSTLYKQLTLTKMNEKWFTSSTGTGDLALTIKGLLVVVLPLAVIAFKYYGVVVTENELLDYTEAIVGGIAAAMILVGLIRKAFNRVPPTDLEI